MSDSARSQITSLASEKNSPRAPNPLPNTEHDVLSSSPSLPAVSAPESPKRERSLSAVSSTTSSAASVSFTLTSMSPSIAPFYPFATVARPTSSTAATTGSRPTSVSELPATTSLASTEASEADPSLLGRDSEVLSVTTIDAGTDEELERPTFAQNQDVEDQKLSSVPRLDVVDQGPTDREKPTMQSPSQPSNTDTDAKSGGELELNKDAQSLGHLAPSSLPSQDSVRSISPTASQSNGPKTPNVYINGLPPHYPEDQLFELAAPFGRIRSVRSFTRHVGEKESGYGFVLFEDVDSAEKCIHALRRFRNLHPTFSKQVHKIPGTPYAHPDANSENAPSVGPADEEEEEETEESITFKRKMEKLSDPASTNLYMEGLPLTIDEPSLSALVAPHRIKSSRFFQTRLSNPPRIIAFVRLETRKGAEEVIERLHGRMVRGWNDSGSRISVRFADTSEQRELRRTERTTKEGEQSPARLTIAQAALLSMHGREKIPSNRTGLFPSASLPTLDVPSSRGTIRTSNSTMGSMYDLPGHAHETAISLPALRNGELGAMNRPVDHRNLAGISPHGGYSRLPPLSIPVTHTQDFPGMMDSLHIDAEPYETYENDFQANRVRPPHHQLNLRPSHILGDLSLNMAIPQQSGAVHAHNGYTPTEEYLLRTHGLNRRRPNRLEMAQARVEAHSQRTETERTALNVGMRGYRSQAATMTLPHDDAQVHTGFARSMRGLPPVRENAGQTTNQHQGSTHGAGAKVRRGSHASPQVTHSQSTRGAPQQDSQSHVRSTTLPPHTTGSNTGSGNRQQGRHFPHNSMSVPRTKNLSADILRSPNHLRSSDHTLSPSISTKDFASNQKTANNVYEHGLKNRHANSTLLSAYPDADAYDDSQPSPSLVSPALTYTSRGSGLTHSPATPFMSSFPSTGPGEKFRGSNDEEAARVEV